MNLKKTTKLLALACLFFAIVLSGCLGDKDPVNSNTPTVEKEKALSKIDDSPEPEAEKKDVTYAEHNDKSTSNNPTSNVNPSDSNNAPKTSSGKDVTFSENNKVVTFNFGENTANGKGWTLTESKSGVLKKTSDSSSSGSHTWSFQGENAGTVVLNFKNQQKTDKGESTESISYTIKVNNDKSIEITSTASSGASASSGAVSSGVSASSSASASSGTFASSSASASTK